MSEESANYIALGVSRDGLARSGALLSPVVSQEPAGVPANRLSDPQPIRRGVEPARLRSHAE
jgi:hypothetical protein